MKKFWHVLAYEYRRNTWTRGFLILCLSIPLLIAISIMVGYLLERSNNSDIPIGYVDDSGFLQDPLPVETLIADVENPRQVIDLRRFETQDAARAALERGEIQAYYWLPPDYPKVKNVPLFFLREPGTDAMLFFWDYIQLHWARQLPKEMAYRAVAGQDVIARTPDGSVEVSDRNMLSAFIPLIAAFFFYIIVMANAQTLLEVVAKEKENRTMEVILTSVPGERLIAAKVAAIFLTMLTLSAVWIGIGAAGVYVGGQLLDLEFLQHISLRPQIVWPMAVLMGLALLFVNGLVVALGASVVEVQEGQGTATLIAMLFYAPIALIVPLTQNPDSPLAVALTLFPFTAPFTTALRLMVIEVPGWQLAISAGLLLAAAGFSIWLAQQSFRLGMLQYGKKLTAGEILRSAMRNQHARRGL